MRAIKKLNNNAVVCIDNNNQELIAIGKGIGFPKTPYDITDLSKIFHTFYQIDPVHQGLFSELSLEIFETSAVIVEQAKVVLKKPLNPNLVVSLADHIDFAIKRLKKFKSMKILFSYEIEQFYPKETQMGRKAVELIGKKLGVFLPDSEITSIALHFVNAQEETTTATEEAQKDEHIISEVIATVEDFFGITMDKKEFSYNRFISHIRYLLIRIEQDEQFVEDEGLFEIFKMNLPKVYECSQHVTHKIEMLSGKALTENEQVYLMVHIQRILQK